MSDTDKHDQEEYEKRLQYRLGLFFESLAAGKIHFNKGLRVTESIQRVVRNPDGTFDLSTVDASVRAAALAIEHIRYRDDTKKAISLKDIQNAYFTFLWNQFENLYSGMKTQNLTPHHVAEFYASDPERVENFLPAVEEIIDTLRTFWTDVFDANEYHLEDIRGTTKGVFGGDLFPSYTESIASKCGIYIDTIILPDPFLRMSRALQFYEPNRRVYYVIKHALNVLKYMDLACSDLPIPILAVYPDKPILEEEEQKYIHTLGMQDGLLLGEKIFGEKFENFEEFVDFSKRFDSLESLLPAIKHPEYILFDTEWGNTASEQLHHALTDNLHQKMSLNNPGFLVANQMASRMSIGNEILLKSRLLGGTPLIDAPTSWKFFTFKLALDAQQCEETKALSHLHITRAMNALAGKEFPWLGRIPHPALIELRQSGAIEEIRQIIGKGIEELTLAASMDFDKTTDRVFYNINNAFEAHQKAIKALTAKKWKFAGTHVTSWLALGAIEISAAATGLPTWGLASFIADQLLPIPKLKDIPKQFAELANSSRELHNSPVGLFFGLSRSQS